jgi:pSer/pThr/pTyr-binding forkhead associated (FHA) protein
VLPDPNQGVPSIQSYGPIHVGTVDFVFDTGQRIRIMGSGLIGRNPSSSDPGVMCTAINDTSISKTHLEYGFDGLGLWIKDRGSTNGSTLVRQGQTTPLQPRAEKQVQVGDVVTIGSRRFVIEGVSR